MLSKINVIYGTVLNGTRIASFSCRNPKYRAGIDYPRKALYDSGVDDNGHAVERNRREAARWLLAAAEQGLPRAQVKLAEVYAAAPDVSGSHAAAGGWFLLAAVGLYGVHRQRARSGYERIAVRLTAAQIDQAKRFVRDWMPKRSMSPLPQQPDEGEAR